jgi:hypothetical protein
VQYDIHANTVQAQGFQVDLHIMHCSLYHSVRRVIDVAAIATLGTHVVQPYIVCACQDLCLVRVPNALLA